MPQDAFHIKRLVRELNTFLVGGKINRISQVNKDELTFIIYTGKSTVKLILSANASNARVCLSETEKEPAPIAPNFCMLLRKHLLGGEILDIRQYAFERIIEIDVLCTTDFSQSKRTLYCELMGKYSNVVLAQAEENEEKGVILGALKTTALEDNSKRVLLSGARYSYPAPQDKLSHLDGAGMRSRLKNHLFNRSETDGESLALFLFDNVAGLALPTARELVKRGLEKYGEGWLEDSCPFPLWNFVGEFCENEPCTPCLRIEKGVIADFFAFPVAGGVETPSLCKAEDEFYTGKESKKGFEDKKRKLESAVRNLKKKQAKKHQETLERLKEAEKAEDYRIKGELLTANLYKVEKGMTSVELENWYSETQEKVKIGLDSTLSPSKNAQRYFKNYNKLKRATEILTPMAKKEEAEMDYTDSVSFSIAYAESLEDLKEIQTELIQMGLLKAQKERVGGKKKEVEVPFRSFEYNGFRILAGRNNLQNDRLLKMAGGEDIWLHTQKYHSSHVILFTDGKEADDKTLEVAGSICAYYSDGRESDKIPVDYCKRKFVKKPSKAKAGFVVYTDYKTMLVKPKLP